MTDGTSIRGGWVVPVISIALLVVGALIAYRPAAIGAVHPRLYAVVRGADPGVVLIVIAVVLVCFTPTLGLIGRLRSTPPRSLSAESEAEGDNWNNGDEVGERDHTKAPVVGAAYDRTVALATTYGDRTRFDREAARAELVRSIRPIAANAYERNVGCHPETARRAVKRGTWTDEPKASAFLADEDGPALPIRVWLVDLLRTGAPYERSLDATLDEIVSLQQSSREPTHTAGGTSSSRESNPQRRERERTASDADSPGVTNNRVSGR